MIERMSSQNITVANHRRVAPDAGLAACAPGDAHAATFFSIIRIIQGR
jgi:hypothetical protein